MEQQWLNMEKYVLLYVVVGLAFAPAGLFYGLLKAYEPLGRWSGHWLPTIILLVLGFMTARIAWKAAHNYLRVRPVAAAVSPAVAFAVLLIPLGLLAALIGLWNVP